MDIIRIPVRQQKVMKCQPFFWKTTADPLRLINSS